MREGWVPLAGCGCCGASASLRVRAVGETSVLRCAGCGTLRADAYRPPDAVYVEGYHLGVVDHVYDATTPHNREYELHIARRRLDLLERHAGRGMLIDVGGGVGNFVRAARARGWDASVLEPVPDAIRDAEAHGIPARLGGVEDLAPGSTDAISMLHVLEHLPEARASLEHVRAALRPQGVVLIEVPNAGSMARRSTGDRWYGWWPGQHVYYFTKRTLAALLRRSGFEPLDVRNITLTWDGLILSHHSYIVGLLPALEAVARARRRVRGRGAPISVAPWDAPASGGVPGSPGMPPPLRNDTPARRSLVPLLGALAHVEERLGVGENLIAVARVSSR